jgi:D-alanyl-D-alanine carboxypeptidase (penicillin-binding protein 5/6)
MLNKQQITTYFFAIVVSLGLAVATNTVAAQKNTPPIPDSAFASKSPLSAAIVIPPAPNVNAKGYALMDAATGQIIASKNMNAKMPPASLTKIMTLYLASKALANGQVHLTDTTRVSDNAWRTGGSRMFIQVGTVVAVEDLLQGIIVDSGNDATVAMAEFLAGSEDSFVPLMNHEAHTLGMLNTHYTDSNGLPHPQHYTTPHDIALLTRALINNYPQYYHWYSQKTYTYNNIRQYNRNRLLWHDTTVDGVKTGHTEAAGYCLVASSKRDGMRLISVIMGAPTDAARANDNEALLNYGFRFYKTFDVYRGGIPIAQARTWLGKTKVVPLGVAKDLYVTLPLGQYQNLKTNITIPNSIKAPIIKGQPYGAVTLMLNNQNLLTEPLVALRNNPKGGIFALLSDYIALGFHKLVVRAGIDKLWQL